MQEKRTPSNLSWNQLRENLQKIVDRFQIAERHGHAIPQEEFQKLCIEGFNVVLDLTAIDPYEQSSGKKTPTGEASGIKTQSAKTGTMGD